MTDPIATLAMRAGIAPSFLDLRSSERVTGRDTQIALLASMGLAVSTEAEATERLAEIEAEERGRVLPEWQVIEADSPLTLPDDITWSLETECGRTSEGRGCLPPLPLGIHALSVAGHQTVLLSAPPRLPEPARTWGLTAPLWGLKGPDAPGIGDFRDLRTAGKAAARRGADFLGINPIHACFPLRPDLPSPYSPSHRRRLNPIHLPEGDGVSSGPLIDYEAEIPAKLAALRAAFTDFLSNGGSDAFAAFRKQEGARLDRFAAHQALSGRHGPYWSDWPAIAQSPETAPLDGLEDEIAFHAWLQWRAHEELTGTQKALLDAGMRYGLYLDLAVGTHPHGAETWSDPCDFARGVSLGAPPDSFSPDGQTWGLAPLDPRALVAGRFRALADTLRRQLRYARLLRIDHILGFERAFWVPEDGTPGAYVAMPRGAMLAVTRIEAARAGATIIGEDLGNIPAGLQDALAASGILGCRVMQFEEDENGFRAPESYARLSLASFGTHDLPTFLGWKAGHDIALRAELGHMDHDKAAEAQAWRTRLAGRFAAAADGADADAMHRFLARTSSSLVAVQAEDVLEVVQQTNLPGTINNYPNWRRRLPVSAAELADDPRFARAAEVLTVGVR